MKRILPDNLEKDCISALLAAIVVSMLAEAFCRHLLPGFHDWPLRAAGGCLAWMASLGMARAAALGLHIRVAFIEGMVAPRRRLLLSRIANAAFLIFSLVSLVVGCLVFFRSLTRANLPSHPLVYAAIPVGSLLTVIRLLERLLSPGERET